MPRWEGALAYFGRHRRYGRRPSLMAACMLSAAAAAVLTDSARADPPPWAYGERSPAENQTAYRFPPGLKDGRCRPDMFNAATIQGLVGPGRTIRSRARLRKDRGAAATLDNTAIGALLTAVGGSRTARGISRQNEICFSQSFEHVPDRTTVAWSDPALAVHYSVTPMRTLKTSDGRFCREYAAKATVNGHAADVYGTACRQPDGAWFLVD